MASDSGNLDERDYYSVRDDYESDQARLGDWTESEETLVSVVRKPGDTQIDKYCDEHWPELGMPEWALDRFWQIRAGYKTNSAVDNPHNKAFEDANLERIYQRHLSRSEEANQRIEEAVQRLEGGENITFVCFEEEGRRCHRHMLLDVVEDRTNFERKFDLSA